MLTFKRHIATTIAAAIPFLALGQSASAQLSFQACSQGSLVNCADIRLTTQLGVGVGGTNLFEIALLNLGSQTDPNIATSIYFLSLATGQPNVPSGTELDVLSTPGASGGATVSDNSPWDIFETGNAIVLSALTNNGVGGCATSSPIGGFGQMGRTCGAGQFITFSFFTPRIFDLSKITLSDLEVAAIAEGNAAESCNSATPCKPMSLASTAAPEPRTILLTAMGFFGIIAFRLFRRLTVATTLTPALEGER